MSDDIDKMFQEMADKLELEFKDVDDNHLMLHYLHLKSQARSVQIILQRRGVMK